MSANAPTSFKELLDNLQAFFSREYSSNPNFRSLHGNYRGAPRNPTRFPYTAIIPIQETNGGIMNGLIDTVRRVRIFAYAHQTQSRPAIRQSMGIIDNIKELFRPYRDQSFVIDKQGGKTTFELFFPNVSYSERPFPWRNGFLQSSFLDIDFISREPLTYQLMNERGVERHNSDSKTISDAIYNTYKAYSVNFLPEVASFKDLSLSPQTKFPVVFLTLEDAAYTRRFAGIDTMNLLFFINVLSRAENSSVALDQNISIIERCKEILFVNCDFEGKAIDYSYQGIDYGQLTSPAGLLYGSSLKFVAQTYSDNVIVEEQTI